MSRAVTALVAGTVMLGTLAGTASAEAPTLPTAHLITDDWSRQVEAVSQAVVNAATGCTADDGACSAARDAALDAVATARACADAMASDAGVHNPVVLAMQRVSLDCAEVVRLFGSLADFTVSVATDCTMERNAVCQAVFDAARLAMDRAQGCLAAVLPLDGAQLAGTDPGCASALGMLWRTAEGIVAMVTGCLHGSDMFCQQAREHAEFARDGLAGCVGTVLWVVPADVQVVPGGGPLPCWAVLDQVAVSVNTLLGLPPNLSTQITPTNEPEECSISVGPPPMPGVTADDPTMAATHYHPEAFVPSCDEPEAIHQTADFTTPRVDATTGLVTPPTCEAKDTYFIDKVKRDGVALKWKDTVGNRNNPKPLKWTVSETVTDEIGLKITAGAEAEGSIWVAKVRATITAEASARREWSHQIELTAEIPMGKEGHLGSFGFTKVVEGRLVREHDDCTPAKSLFRRVRVPYRDMWDFWLEPYNG